MTQVTKNMSAYARRRAWEKSYPVMKGKRKKEKCAFKDECQECKSVIQCSKYRTVLEVKEQKN